MKKSIAVALIFLAPLISNFAKAASSVEISGSSFSIRFKVGAVFKMLDESQKRTLANAVLMGIPISETDLPADTKEWFEVNSDDSEGIEALAEIVTEYLER